MLYSLCRGIWLYVALCCVVLHYIVVCRVLVGVLRRGVSCCYVCIVLCGDGCVALCNGVAFGGAVGGWCGTALWFFVV